MKGALRASGMPPTAGAVLDYWAGDELALRSGAIELTYGQAAAETVALARNLQDLGLRSGDRLAIVGENDPGVVIAIFAAWKLGAWAVPLNARFTARELDQILDHAQPRITIYVGDEGAPAFDHARRLGADNVLSVRLKLRHGPPANVEPEPIDPDPAEQIAELLYTSGTTGSPKAVMLPHRAVVAMADLWAQGRAIEPGELVYQVLPLSHSYGLNSLLIGALNRGCAVELVSRFDPAHLHQAFSRDVVLFQGVPTMYALYLEYLDKHGLKHEAPKLRSISTGGAPLDPALQKRVEEVFGTPLRQGYGLTEAGPSVTAPRPNGGGEFVLGDPLPGVEIRIVDEHSGQQVSDGQAGELWVKGPGVMLGYYRDPAATAAVLSPDGWLRTGDLVRQAPSGELVIAGRARDIIIRSGFNVHPSEVEKVLSEHPAVQLAAVVGRPALNQEEDVVAFIQLRPGHAFEMADIAGHCAERLTGYKRPTEIICLDALPLGLNGKVQTKALRVLALEHGRSKDACGLQAGETP